MSSTPTFQILASPTFPAWLAERKLSLAFSTYQLGKLFFVGMKPETGRLSVFERTFNRCLGLWSDQQRLWLASAYQLWRLENVLEPGAMTDDGYDALYVPREAITTGDVDVHDVIVESTGKLVFVNTLFCCLATVSERFNFEPLWQPPFIDRLAAEDRCHLNGLASDQGAAKFATACSQTNEFHGWRQHRADGGCVIHIPDDEIVTTGLSMPHSPRVYRNELWVLNSGRGYFGRIDRATGAFEPVALCPGYARGLAFYEDYAIVGTSRPREKTFAGLPLDDELQRHKVNPVCGLFVIDLKRGEIVEWLQIEGRVDELYDVLVLPGIQRPKALGLKTDEIRRNVWFRDRESGTVSRWTAGDKNPD